MPGKSTYTFTGPSSDGQKSVYRLDVISPKVTDRTVFFTDESPEFKVRVENLTNKPIEGPLTLFIGYGTGTFEHVDREKFDIDIEPHSHEIYSISDYLLAYQGNGIIAHYPPTNFRERDDDNYIEIYSNLAEDYVPLYTFTIWDRHFYRANYQWPRRAQFASAILAVFIILVGVVQILVNQGFL